MKHLMSVGEGQRWIYEMSSYSSGKRTVREWWWLVARICTVFDMLWVVERGFVMSIWVW